MGVFSTGGSVVVVEVVMVAAVIWQVSQYCKARLEISERLLRGGLSIFGAKIQKYQTFVLSIVDHSVLLWCQLREILDLRDALAYFDALACIGVTVRGLPFILIILTLPPVSPRPCS